MSMLNRMALPILLAFVPALAGASESPMTTGVSVLFSSGSYQFTPNNDVRMILGNLRSAAMITVNGRTSGASSAEKNEKLALARAIAARNWLVTQGVAPEKVMINFASGVDFIAPNSTPEGQLLNQRVDIEATYVSFSSSAILAKSPASRTQYRCPIPPSNGSTPLLTRSEKSGTTKPFSFVASTTTTEAKPRFSYGIEAAPSSQLAEEVAKKINAAATTSVPVGTPITTNTNQIEKNAKPTSTFSHHPAIKMVKTAHLNKGFLRDELEKNKATLGITSIVWNGVPDCLDWPIHAGFSVSLDDKPKAISDIFKGYPLIPKLYMRDGTLEVIPSKPLYQYGECSDE
ncbi:MAG: OmpA family protein [Aeromonadaceae bacterium]